MMRIILAVIFVLIIAYNCTWAAPVLVDIYKLSDDPALNRTIEIAAEGIPVSDALALVGAKAQMTIGAGVDANDWMVRDRKVIIFARDIRVRDLMQELSVLLRFHWKRNGEPGKYVYMLLQDKREFDEEASLRASVENEQAKEARRKREDTLAEMANLSSLSPTDAAALQSSNPWKYILATEPLGSGVVEFVNSYPEARAAFVRNSEAVFPVASLSPEMRSTVRKIAESYGNLMKSIGAGEDQSALLADFDRLQINLNRRAAGRSDVISKSLLGSISIGSGDQWLYIPLFDPSEAMAKALGRAIVDLKAGKSKDAVGERLKNDIAQAAETATPITPSLKDTASDPSLQKSIALFAEPTIAPLPMSLQVLAEKSGLDIISDYFPGARPTLNGESKSIGAQLEAISAAYGAGWTKAGSIVRLTDREWFRKRAYEVPRVWIDYWISRAREKVGLMLEELVQISKLRDEQIDNTILNNPDLVGYGAGEAARNRHILRFYASLTNEQMKLMATGPLHAGSINDEQWAFLQKALAGKGAAYAAAAKGPQFIRLTWSGSDVVEYRFDYYSAPNEPAVTFKITSGVVYKPTAPKQQ